MQYGSILYSTILKKKKKVIYLLHNFKMHTAMETNVNSGDI